MTPLKFIVHISQYSESKFHLNKPHADSCDHYAVMSFSSCETDDGGTCHPFQRRLKKCSQGDFTVSINGSWHQQNEGHQEAHNKQWINNLNGNFQVCRQVYLIALMWVPNVLHSNRLRQWYHQINKKKMLACCTEDTQARCKDTVNFKKGTKTFTTAKQLANENTPCLKY